MDVYEAINKRRTVREFLDKEVDFEAIKRILDAGNKAPTWNHNRNWSYIVLKTDKEKEYAFEYAKKIADKFDAQGYLNRPKPYPTTLAQKMYAHAMPRQFTMLKNAPYVVIPVFKSKELNGEYVSKLNPFSTIWCVIENIFLAATAEGLSCSMRIPLNEEHDIVKEKLKVPPTYMIPVFIGIGHADSNEYQLEQNTADLEKQLHFGRWKQFGSNMMKPVVQKINVKSVLTKSNLPVADFSVNPYIGCTHACKYCYACFMKRFTNHAENWGEFLDVKYWEPIKNLKKYEGKEFFFGSVTDPYNPQEEEFRRTRALLEELQGNDIKISIQTKSDLVLRDINLIKTFPNARVGFSINTLDEAFRADMDNAVSIERRLSAMKKLHDEGIRTTCFISPIFPPITDLKAIF